MSTKIEYVDETISPIQDKIKGKSGRGYHCTKCSPGCLHCYAEGINHRFGNHLPFDNRDVEFELIQSELEKPLRWKKSKRIFIQSMGDLFHEKVLRSTQYDILEIMKRCQWHTFLLLTKRPKEMADFFRWAMRDLRLSPHIFLGVTVCNQAEADEKIPILLSIPCFKKWISIEPILSEVQIQQEWLNDNDISWVVSGCETGPGARPADNEWFRSTRDQCRVAGVPYFQKATTGPIPDDLTIKEWPE